MVGQQNHPYAGFGGSGDPVPVAGDPLVFSRDACDFIFHPIAICPGCPGISDAVNWFRLFGKWDSGLLGDPMLRIIFLGIVLSSRPIYVLNFPLWIGLIGWRRFFGAATVSALFTGAFWFWSSSEFTPFHLGSVKYSDLLALAMIGVSLFGECVAESRKDRYLFSAVVLAMPAFLLTLHAPQALLALPLLAGYVDDDKKPPNPGAMAMRTPNPKTKVRVQRFLHQAGGFHPPPF